MIEPTAGAEEIVMHEAGSDRATGRGPGPAKRFYIEQLAFKVEVYYQANADFRVVQLTEWADGVFTPRS